MMRNNGTFSCASTRRIERDNLAQTAKCIYHKAITTSDNDFLFQTSRLRTYDAFNARNIMVFSK